MNYHNITKADMLNGEGLRVVLWVSGCEHNCKGCHNPQTHSYNSGIPFNEEAKDELFKELEKQYISGITFSGGDPLALNNRLPVLSLAMEVKEKFPNKTIWCYTGYKYEQLINDDSSPTLTELLGLFDVLVDGKYMKCLADTKLPYRGSTNQRLIDVKKSLASSQIILLDVRNSDME